jgi:hypothetical protein
MDRAQINRSMLNFHKALAYPDKWCCSGRCKDTNWGGHDRLHMRFDDCPAYDAAELMGYIEKGKALMKVEDSKNELAAGVREMLNEPNAPSEEQIRAAGTGWPRHELHPGRWWRVLGMDGDLWCETSDEDEARECMRPGDTLHRLFVELIEEWREVA